MAIFDLRTPSMTLTLDISKQLFRMILILNKYISYSKILRSIEKIMSGQTPWDRRTDRQANRLTKWLLYRPQYLWQWGYYNFLQCYYTGSTSSYWVLNWKCNFYGNKSLTIFFASFILTWAIAHTWCLILTHGNAVKFLSALVAWNITISPLQGGLLFFTASSTRCLIWTFSTCDQSLFDTENIPKK